MCIQVYTSVCAYVWRAGAGARHRPWSCLTFCIETLLSLESDWESSVSPIDLSSLWSASYCSLS